MGSAVISLDIQYIHSGGARVFPSRGPIAAWPQATSSLRSPKPSPVQPSRYVAAGLCWPRKGRGTPTHASVMTVRGDQQPHKAFIGDPKPSEPHAGLTSRSQLYVHDRVEAN